MFTMPEDDNSKQDPGPGPPWFKCATPSLILKVVTMGRGMTIFSQRLTVSPAPPPPYLSKCDDDNLDILYNNYPFNWAISFALY